MTEEEMRSAVLVAATVFVRDHREDLPPRVHTTALLAAVEAARAHWS